MSAINPQLYCQTASYLRQILYSKLLSKAEKRASDEVYQKLKDLNKLRSRSTLKITKKIKVCSFQ